MPFEQSISSFSVEATLPKQNRNIDVKEFKHAVVAHKRRCKAHLVERADNDFSLGQSR